MKEQGQKLAAAGTALTLAEIALAHFGGPGVIVGLAAGAAAYVATDSLQKAKHEKQAGGTPPPAVSIEKEHHTAPEHPSLAYRLLNGKSVRSGNGAEPLQRPPTPTNNTELAAPRKRSGVFSFSDVLESFTPSLNKIYLGTLEDGKMVFCHAEELCHVALAGATRGGKSSIMRMLMAQLCYAGANVLILNPHYSRYILDKKEDWTPFEPYLVYDPMECRRYEIIEHYLKQVATELLPKRLDRFAHSQPVGKPYFLVLDELPAIVDHLPDAPLYLKAILREGAKVGLFLITAAQDFLVSTIFPKGGGAVRDCYRTVEYVGGDATTANVLLDMPAKDVPENRLGKGTVMLRCDLVKPAAIARVPLVDNEALYLLLGPSTYQASKQQRQEEDDLMSYAVGSPDDEEEERNTETLPTQTRRHVPTSAYDAHRQRIASRKTPAYAMRTQEERGYPVAKVPELPAQKSEIDLALEAYDRGNTTIDSLAVALNTTPWKARPIYAQVKRIREQK